MFIILFWLVFLGALLYLAGIYKTFYQNLTINPSGGHEDIYPRAFPLYYYRFVALIHFSIISFATICGILDIISKIIDPRWRLQFNSFYFGNILFLKIIWLIFFFIMSLPIIYSLLSWFLRLLNLFVGIRLKKYGAFFGKEYLDSITRPGLYDEIKASLGGDILIYVRGGPFGVVALFKKNIFQSKYILTIHANFFHRIGSQEREAIIWHEVGHFKQRSFLHTLVVDLVFNIWAKLMRPLLDDSVLREVKADKFAVHQMKEQKEPLIRALEELRKAQKRNYRTPLGIGYSDVNKFGPHYITFSSLKNFIRMLQGEERLPSFYPSEEIRIKQLFRSSV